MVSDVLFEFCDGKELMDPGGGGGGRELHPTTYFNLHIRHTMLEFFSTNFVDLTKKMLVQ